MDIGQFRIDFPEFCEAARYPKSTITWWSNLGEKLISEERFGDCWLNAVELFTAHNISLAAQNVKDSAAGKVPGSRGGAVNSKAVGPSSVSYDNASSMEDGAGHWNQTTYGRQYIQLARLMGHGCIQL